MTHPKQYIRQWPSWSRFRWDNAPLLEPLGICRFRQGALLTKMGKMGFEVQQQSRVEIIQMPKTIYITVLLIFSLYRFANGYTDMDVKLFNAGQAGDVEKIKVFLDQGADINVRLGVDQWTPLMTASREGQLEAVGLLLAQGADSQYQRCQI